MADKLIILNVNIRSLNANIDNLKVFIERLKYKPHVIVCSESWNIKHPDYFNFNNYEAHYNNSLINQADGVVIFVDKSLNYKIEFNLCQKLKTVSCIITHNLAKKI